jgi:hypothetical protein
VTDERKPVCTVPEGFPVDSIYELDFDHREVVLLLGCL